MSIEQYIKERIKKLELEREKSIELYWWFPIDMSIRIHELQAVLSKIEELWK